MSENDKDFIDVDFEDISKHINGEPLFYTAIQVAGLIGEKVSTVRFWTKRFEHLLDIEISNKNKQYKKSDIVKLKFIKKLAKTDGLTLQQVEDYCSSKGFDIDNIEKAIIDGSNPLAVQTIVTALTVELEKKLDSKLNILYEKVYQTNQDTLNAVTQKLDTFLQMQNDMNMESKAEVEASVDLIMDNKSEQIKKDIHYEVSNIVTQLEEQSTQLQQKFQSIIDDNEKKATERDIKMTDNLNKIMEDRKRQYEEQEDKKHKHFSIFSRFFNNKKE